MLTARINTETFCRAHAQHYGRGTLGIDELRIIGPTYHC